MSVGVDGEHLVGPYVVPGDLANREGYVLQWMWQSLSDGGGYISCADIEVSLDKEPCGVVAELSGRPDELDACATGELGGDGAIGGVTVAAVGVLLVLVVVICLK
eukprot:SAG31_NODE_9065_length_1341_cov_1.074074_1_plen_104_part_01